MSAHTPGPWRWVNGALLADHGRRSVVLMSGCRGYLVANVPATGLVARFDDKSDDARLIAAAPELLSTCEAMDAWLANTGHDSDHPWRRSLARVIALATISRLPG